MALDAGAGAEPFRANFPTTRWSVVLTARAGEALEARSALAALCENYWRPIYAYLRRSGESPADAEDLTQEFFSRVLDGGFLETVHPAKGRFRSYLLACLKHFLSNERRREQAQRRGGNVEFVHWDSVAEEQLRAQAMRLPGPDEAYDRQWAITLLQKVLQRLSEESQRAGKEAEFEALAGFLTGDQDDQMSAAARQILGLSEGAFRVAVHRLRKRYRQCIISEIAETVGQAEDAAEELRYLIQIWKPERKFEPLKNSCNTTEKTVLHSYERT